jgi:RNA polymerase sigma-70 factor, ECF subfamily
LISFDLYDAKRTEQIRGQQNFTESLHKPVKNHPGLPNKELPHGESKRAFITRILAGRISSYHMEPDMLPEHELLQRARQFETQALAQIYDTFSPGLYRYAMRRLGDATLAEDCTADIFRRFLEALQGGRGPGDFLQAYLYRMAHNWVVDHYRGKVNLAEELSEEQRDEQADPEKDTSQTIRRERLRVALRQLTPDQQQVVALKYLEGWENEEIARTLKKPVGAVKSLQHRALAALQKLLLNEDLL